MEHLAPVEIALMALIFAAGVTFAIGAIPREGNQHAHISLGLLFLTIVYFFDKYLQFRFGM